METPVIDNFEHPHNVAFAQRTAVGRTFGIASGRLAHFPASTRLATVIYFRPASCAEATASASGHSSRTLASFTSIGRLMPARTSTFGRFMTEIERFDGVPTNKLVRFATP